MKTGFVYSLNHPHTGEPRYIGWSVNPYNRWYAHISDSEKSYKVSWMRALKKEGLLPIMQIIDEVPLSESAFWEQHYISLYRSWGFRLTNLTIGGDGTKGYKWTKENIEKVKKSKIEKGSYFIGAKKASITKRRNGDYARAAHQMRAMQLAKVKPILQYSLKGDFIKEWKSTSIAAENLNISRDNISRCCTGEYGQTHGFQFRYKTENYELKLPSYNSNSIRKKYKTKTKNYEQLRMWV